MNYRIRDIKTIEYPILADFLYDAIYLPDGVEPLPRSIIDSPELQVYISRFGKSKHDRAVVAEVEGTIVGVIWTRIMHDYGNIDKETPSIAMAVKKDYRALGIGTALLKELLNMLKEKKYCKVSLSVQKANYAVKLYQNNGFVMYAEKDEEYIMIAYL